MAYKKLIQELQDVTDTHSWTSCHINREPPPLIEYPDTGLLPMHQVFSLINLMLSVHDCPPSLPTRTKHRPLSVGYSQCSSHHPHPAHTLITSTLRLLLQQTHCTQSIVYCLRTLCSPSQYPLKLLHLHNSYHVFNTP